MQKIFILLTLFFICCFSNVSAQKKYEGILFSKFGEAIKGDIKVNLDGANKDLIEVSTTVKTKTKRSKEVITTSSRINIAMIDYLLINGIKYYLRDIEIGYNEKYLRNACVTLLSGNLNCGIFQMGDGKKQHTIAFKFPKHDYSKLISVDFEYYSTSSTLLISLMACKPLKEKLVNKDSSISWEENATREERIKKFTTIVTEFNECKADTK